MFSVARPGGAVRATGRQLTVASIAGRAAAAAPYCRYGLTLSAPVRCGAIGGGGGQPGADAPYYPAETESVYFPSLIHGYDNTIDPWLIAIIISFRMTSSPCYRALIQSTLSASAR